MKRLTGFALSLKDRYTGIPWNKTYIFNQCLFCDKTFRVPPSRIKRGGGKYCSMKHLNIAQKGRKFPERLTKRIEGNCEICNKITRETPYRKSRGMGKYCSRACQNISRKGRVVARGENAPGWKGGVTSLKITIRNSTRYNQWRFAIFERDNFTCLHCGSTKGGDFQVDHYPITFAQLIETYKIKTLEEAEECKELWNMENGRTLCVACHKKTPTYLKPLPHHTNLLREVIE